MLARSASVHDGNASIYDDTMYIYCVIGSICGDKPDVAGGGREQELVSMLPGQATPLRNQMHLSTFLVQNVLKISLFSFDLAVCAPASLC